MQLQCYKKQLTATASISTENKVYDSKTALREGQTVTYTIGTGEVQSFNSVTDDVKVTADANYKSADVSKTGETINNVGIEFYKYRPLAVMTQLTTLCRHLLLI